MQGRAAQCMVMGAWRVEGSLFPHFPISDPAHEPRADEGERECQGRGPSCVTGPVCRNIPPLTLDNDIAPTLVLRYWHQGSGLYHRVMFRAELCTCDLCNV